MDIPSKEQIRRSQCGPLLDGWVAKHIFGWSHFNIGIYDTGSGSRQAEPTLHGRPPGENFAMLPVPFFSKDKPWGIVDKMTEDGYKLHLHVQRQHVRAAFAAAMTPWERWDTYNIDFVEKTAGEAISKAALFAKLYPDQEAERQRRRLLLDARMVFWRHRMRNPKADSDLQQRCLSVYSIEEVKALEAEMDSRGLVWDAMVQHWYDVEDNYFRHQVNKLTSNQKNNHENRTPRTAQNHR